MPHLHDRYERVFAPRLLFGLNVAVIATAELAGEGRAFHDRGLIFVPAFLFIALACARISTRFPRYDAALQRFLLALLTALAMLCAAQLVEVGTHLTSHVVPQGDAYGTVIFLQIASLLTIGFGSYHVLRSYGKLGDAMPWFALSSLVGVVAFCAALAAFLGVIVNVPPPLYTALAAMAGLGVAMQMHHIGRSLSFLQEFSAHLSAAATFITLSVAANTLHFVADASGIMDRQAAYAANFALVAAVSFVFLGVGRLINLGEEYRTLSKFEKKGWA